MCDGHGLHSFNRDVIWPKKAQSSNPADLKSCLLYVASVVVTEWLCNIPSRLAAARSDGWSGIGKSNTIGSGFNWSAHALKFAGLVRFLHNGVREHCSGKRQDALV